jgi:hypothetical protein
VTKTPFWAFLFVSNSPCYNYAMKFILTRLGESYVWRYGLLVVILVIGNIALHIFNRTCEGVDFVNNPPNLTFCSAENDILSFFSILLIVLPATIMLVARLLMDHYMPNLRHKALWSVGVLFLCVVLLFVLLFALV